MADEELEALRAQIDALDEQLVKLLDERAEVVQSIGARKRGTGTPIYTPHREAAVLNRVFDHHRGPFPRRALEAVYRELMSGSFALERPLRVAVLGPEGSFSHASAVAHFGSSVDFHQTEEIGDVFDAVVRGHSDYGLVPIENSIGGGVVETLDAFANAADELVIYAEVVAAIRHHLMGYAEPGSITRILSKPEVFAQCRNWARRNYPHAELVPCSSSSAAVERASKNAPGDGVAAIGSTLAGQLYGVPTLFESIEDEADNLTRFFVVARELAEPSGDDKTTLTFRTKHEPGALARVLDALGSQGVDLTHIDKRPSRRENWSYRFFVDAVGHRDEPRLKAALEAAEPHCMELRVLGSYPRARRVL